MKREVKKSGVRLTKRLRIGLIVAGVVVLGLIGWLVWSNIRSHDTDIDTNKYQAVFLANGQVYFGKLQPIGKGSMKLTKIFYLQSQDSNGGGENPQQTTTADKNVQLIKLGSEVHGPEDEMVINKDQILFYENLKSDSKVAQTIDSFNK